MHIEHGTGTEPGRPSLVVSLTDPVEAVLLCRALRAVGGAAVACPPDESLVGRCRAKDGAVVEARSAAHGGGLPLVRALRRRYPSLPIVVVREAGDVVAAWSAMRAGAMSWSRPASQRCWPWSGAATADLVDHARHTATTLPATTVDAVRWDVDSALRNAAAGEVEGAISALWRIQRCDGIALGLDALGEVQAAVLARLGRRARYPIRVEHVLDRLDVQCAEDRVRCELLLRDALRRGGRGTVPRHHRASDLPASEQLYVAFHVTAALARFAAARSWIDVSELLDRLAAPAAPADVPASDVPANAAPV